MGHYKSKSGTGSNMLKLLVLLIVCVTDMYGEYVMPGLGNSGRVRPIPTRPPTTTAPPPACDSCCPEPPPENADDETMKLCAQLTFEVTPICMNATNIDSDECFRRVEQELGNEGIMDTCKCEAWKQLKEELMVSVELVCDDSRKGKNQCITPLGQVLWWRYLHCHSLNFVGRFGCLWFLNNQRCFTTWAHRPVWPI